MLMQYNRAVAARAAGDIFILACYKCANGYEQSPAADAAAAV
jgi:hypothetical protein